MALDLNSELKIDRLRTRVFLMPLFSIAQQHGLLGFYQRRFREVLPGEWTPLLASARIFALLHVPDLPVTFMTLAVSIGRVSR